MTKIEWIKDPPIKYVDLVFRAVKWANAFPGYREKLNVHMPPKRLRGAVMGYLRHKCTNFDDVRNNHSGVMPCNEYLHLRHEVDRTIKERMTAYGEQ